MSKSNLLILERSLSQITINEESKNSGEYVLEGIFSEIGVKNKNNRIYDESEFIPHIEELAKQVESKKILGELDHPKQFEISLKNVSHVIESIYYDKNTKQVKGKIRLLDTDAGKQAKALVDGGVPIHISSRAAGVVEGNGHVKIKKLFTYDLVADPGFENAQLNRINESFGLEDDSNIQIYKIDENVEETENTEMELKETETQENVVENTESTENTQDKKESYITVEDFNEYTQIIKGQFNTLKENLEGVKTEITESTSDVKPEGDLIKYVEKIAETVNSLSESVEETTENVDNLISHNDYIIEGLENVKNYTETVALKTDQGIEYTKSIAEKLDQNIEYSKMLAENLDNAICYSENTNESLDGLIEYTKNVAETVDNRMQYQDTINEELDNVISHNDYIIENMNGISKYQNYLKENVENLGNYTESIVNQINEENGFSGEITNQQEYQNLTESVNLPELEENDTWKKNILESIKSLTESAKKQKAVEESKELNFLNFLSESKRTEFNNLEESKKEDVILAFNENKYFGSKDVERIYESVFVDQTPKTDLWLDNMPSKYSEQWNSLDESRRNEIKAQASVSNLNTQYQIDHFWSTRDLRGAVVSLNEDKTHATDEKVVTESSKYETPNAYMDAVKAGLAKRFGK